jgi:hypothetical protein
MEDLTKQQIVLVTLLVSFVTSIATGIITVSMMNQAPQTFTQTVNRVVERTIERVVPDASLVKAVEPKIITLEDQVARASEIGLESVTKIIDEENKVVATSPVISKTGKVIAYIPNGKYSVQYADGQKYKAIVASSSDEFIVLVPETDKKFTPVSIAKDIKTGKTVVLIAGDTVYQGIIQNASTTATSIDPNKTINGSFLLDLTGSLVGVNINNTFVPARIITPYI